MLAANIDQTEGEKKEVTDGESSDSVCKLIKRDTARKKTENQNGKYFCKCRFKPNVNSQRSNRQRKK